MLAWIQWESDFACSLHHLALDQLIEFPNKAIDGILSLKHFGDGIDVLFSLLIESLSFLKEG